MAKREPIPELVGLAEATELLGVRTRQHAHNLTRHPTFPVPVQRLKATPIWLRSEVEAWAKERRS